MTREFTLTADPQSAYSLLGEDIRYTRGVQLTLTAGSAFYGDKDYQDKPVNNNDEVLPVDNLKNLWLRGAGATVIIAVFT